MKLAGRSKNVWESPNGCLSFSFTTQMEDGRAVPLVQYVVSLAVTEAIKDICDKNVSDCNFFDVQEHKLSSAFMCLILNFNHC